ncbi:MAG: hypothetical protein KDJ53_01215 [Rhodobiaceae bacterium]|nr:hypothetical protein [Rhodobiaceae bacterium]
MTALAWGSLVLLFVILVPLFVWVRKRQKAYGPVIRAGGEAETLSLILEEQKKLNDRLDELTESLKVRDARASDGGGK